MLKVSIFLPDSTQITFESDGGELLHEILSIALWDLPRDLIQGPSTDYGPPASAPVEQTSALVEKRSNGELSAATTEPAPEPAPTMESPAIEYSVAPTLVTPQKRPGPSASNGNEPAASEMPPEFLSVEGRNDFVAFCKEANPMGDMRRVVVAAEGANRLLGMDSVDATELETLFGLAGWRLPHNFIQTLRNAARDKFRWLERVPGRAGKYSTTELGRSVTLS
mgnify:CR=1 FL=1